MRALVRWFITTVAVIAAAYLVPGITIRGNGLVTVIVMGAALGLANAYLRPILKAVACGAIFLTLGLFTLVVNAGTFWIASWVSTTWLGAGFHVDGFWPAFWGAIVVSVVSFLLSWLLPDEDRD